MNTPLSFRDYTAQDQATCLRIFDANCPTYFAPVERKDYQQFLESGPDAYELCLLSGRVVGAFGVFKRDGSACSLNWILLDPEVQGQGLGAGIMEGVTQRARAHNVAVLQIAASHLSAPFFEKFGAVEISRSEHGWGPDIHRVDMVLTL